MRLAHMLIMLLIFHSLSKFLLLKGVLLQHCQINTIARKIKFIYKLRFLNVNYCLAEQFETFPMLNKDVLGVIFWNRRFYTVASLKTTS